MSSVIHFVIPLRAAGSCSNWDKILEAFHGTLASLLGQGDPAWRATVVCHEIPDDMPADDRIEAISLDLPIPSERAGFARDKDAKVKRGLDSFLDGDATHYMVLDADDRLHEGLVAYVRTAPDTILLIRNGYVYGGTRFVRRHADNFDKLCGSVVIVPRRLAEDGVHPIYWGHYRVPETAKEKGYAVTNVPFPAAVKNVAYGDNMTETLFLFSGSLRRTARKILSLRRLGNHQLRAFALDTHP